MIATDRKEQTEKIIETLNVFVGPGNVCEIRALGVDGRKNRTDAGYFDDFEKAARAVLSIPKPKGIYFVLNAVNPALLARASNRIEQWANLTTSDKDIIRRRWLLIDCDPVRPSGISASEVELNEASDRADDVTTWLREEGFPEPILAKSGNGAHLQFPIDLPNDNASTALVKSILEAADAKFTDDTVSIDTAVSNAARICRLYGTTARKGDDDSIRSHRISEILYNPADLKVTPLAALNAVAAMAPQPKAKTPSSTYNGPESRLIVADYLNSKGIVFEAAPGKGFTKYVLEECPFNPEHKSPDSMVTQADSGALGFKCLHNSCSGNKWPEFKASIGEPSPEHWNPPKVEKAAVDLSRLSGHDIPAPGNHQGTEGSTAIWTPQLIGDIHNPPEENQPIIDGMLRRAEVGSIIAVPKAAKSWMITQLAMCVIQGKPWLGRDTKEGHVLLIDNELRKNTIQGRVSQVAGAMGVSQSVVDERFSFVALRGVPFHFLPELLTLLISIRREKPPAIF